MLEISLTIHSPAGTMQIPMTQRYLSLGRGDDADICIDDPGLSRVHASLHSDDERIWILDEGSTNGCLVNGKPVPAKGTALVNGDKISMGDFTTAWVGICGQPLGKTPETLTSKIAFLRMLIIALPIAILAVAMFYFLNTAKVSEDHAESASANRISSNTLNVREESEPGPALSDNSSISSLGVDTTAPKPSPLLQTPALKLYRQMTEEEKKLFISSQAVRISKKMGNRPCDFTPGALQRIKEYVDSYSKRMGNKSQKLWGEDLSSLYERATRYAPLINRWFTKYDVNPEVGLYMAMIETEYHECLKSPAGALGMFQFMPGTAKTYDTQPDERCNVEKLAPAAARYFKDLIAYFGADATSVALAIASYNRGEGNIMGDLHKVVEDGGERSFWTLVENPEKLHAKFQSENIKYVPKFFAAAIVGENPREFGLNINPLSSYTQ